MIIARRPALRTEYIPVFCRECDEDSLIVKCQNLFVLKNPEAVEGFKFDIVCSYIFISSAILEQYFYSMFYMSQKVIVFKNIIFCDDDSYSRRFSRRRMLKRMHEVSSRNLNNAKMRRLTLEKLLLKVV